MHGQPSDTSAEPLKAMLKRFCIVVVFGIAFGYIEAAVVVYLRTIFHPSGFTFPLTEFGISPLWKRLLTNRNRQRSCNVSSNLYQLPGCSAKNYQQRFAFFLTIFAVWDIFYYIWLKVLLDWPSSIMDWDILFLIPTAWAGPVLAPILVSLTLLIFAIIILYCCCCGRILKPTPTDWLVFIVAALVVVASFCIAGLHAAEADFQSHFHWPLFAAGLLSAVALFAKCLLKFK